MKRVDFFRIIKSSTFGRQTPELPLPGFQSATGSSYQPLPPPRCYWNEGFVSQLARTFGCRAQDGSFYWILMPLIWGEGLQTKHGKHDHSNVGFFMKTWGGFCSSL